MNLNLKKRLNTIERFMKSVRLVLFFNRAFDLYELMNVKYLAFHMELQKRGTATIRRGQTQNFLFFSIIRSGYTAIAWFPAT